MLNALRHRRWNQGNLATTDYPVSKCSTPCGIEDGISINYAPFGNMRTVLNALRHRRWNQYAKAVSIESPYSAQRLAASKMESGYSPLRNSLLLYSAQRLAASKMESVPAWRLVGLHVHKCSTPCGIEDGISVSTAGVSAFKKCAQRLAASKMESVWNGLNNRLTIWCSTPCGIEDGIRS